MVFLRSRGYRQAGRLRAVGGCGRGAVTTKRATAKGVVDAPPARMKRDPDLGISGVGIALRLRWDAQHLPRVDLVRMR